jgi:signal transduction histidine kinase
MDEERMRLVLVSLVRNAMEHTPRGGRVHVIVRELDADRSVECVVKDTGPGFADGERERVFEPFFSTRKGGAGLGMALAARIVLEHDGTISASNNPAGGAVVTVRLPGFRESRATS